MGDELGHRLGWKRWIDLHDIWNADDARDGRDVADEIEIELVVERRVVRVRTGGQEKRIAVRRRAHDGFSSDIATAARPILDDELLAEPLGQRLCDQPREDVGPTARGKANDDAHRPRRIGLRPSEA